MVVIWPQVLSRLVAGESLERDEAAEVLAEILAGDVDPLVIASVLTALTAKGENVEEMTGFVDAMIAASDTFSCPPGTMDIVGTGGDRLHSVNISTMAALTVAACGVPVAKHGNRAASSSVGTADVLEALGVGIDAPSAVVSQCITEAGIGFCFARRFHPGLAFLGPIRAALGFPTVFNILGPLANPAGVRRLLVGVATNAMLEPMALVLQRRGVDHAILVHSDDGLDELSLGSTASIVEVTPGSMVTTRLDASEVLHVHHPVSALVGGDVATNAAAVRAYVAGARGAVFDTVTANAGLALVVAGRATSLEDGTRLAAAAVLQGSVAETLASLVRVSNQ